MLACDFPSSTIRTSRAATFILTGLTYRLLLVFWLAGKVKALQRDTIEFQT